MTCNRSSNAVHADMPSSIPARILAGALVLVIVAGVAGCAQKTTTRGNLPTEAKLSQVTVGVHKKNDVRTLLGAPSTIGTFEDSVLGTTSVGIRHSLRFSVKRSSSKWSSSCSLTIRASSEQIEVFDKDDLREISLIERKTPTAGHSLGFFEQILGNIGRFNK